MTSKRTPAHETEPDASTDVETNAVSQRNDDDYKVGRGRPPKEHQFKAGESGNPDGPPKGRTHLWTHFTKYMAMTDTRIATLNRDKLTQAQHVALNLVEKIKAGEKIGSTAFARYIVDREEGKAAEHLILDNGADLSDDECEELRKLIQGKHGRDTD
jgi:hypothetical protein